MLPIEEETRRLTAGWLNIVAASVISIGAVAPLAAMVLCSFGGTSGPPSVAIAAVCLSFLALGIGLHLGARALLSRR